jgi:hypothetical protein
VPGKPISINAGMDLFGLVLDVMLSPWAEDLWLLFLVSILTLVGVVDEDV